ncbi:MAG: hypothetical protein ACJ8LM_02165 [Candidatus Udaeobacter sp.]
MKPAFLSLFAAMLILAPGAPSPGASRTAQSPAPQQSPAGQNPSPTGSAGQNTGDNPESAPPDSQQTPSLEQQEQKVESRVVSLSDEPHHRLILQNDFANVYTVAVPPNDTTLMHRHDLPYLGLTFGGANVTNMVQGQKETTLNLRDGQVVYSPGGFTHIVRTNSGSAFRNVTVELVKPQGTARNLCKQVVEGPLSCAQQQEQQATTKDRGSKKKTAAIAAEADDMVPYFETDEVRVEVVTVSMQREYVDASPKENALLVAMTNSNMNADVGGHTSAFLHSGDILWMPAGEARKVNDFLGTRSNFLLVSFKDANTAKP